jgi:small subunit ribosomal protein S21
MGKTGYVTGVLFGAFPSFCSKALKKLMLKDGLFQEMKRREHYEKPSVKRKRKQAQARKKLRKAMKRASLHDNK